MILSFPNLKDSNQYLYDSRLFIYCSSSSLSIIESKTLRLFAKSTSNDFTDNMMDYILAMIQQKMIWNLNVKDLINPIIENYKLNKQPLYYI